MRLLRISFATVILLGVAWIVGMRISAPHRHNRELTHKMPFFQKVISDLQASDLRASTSLTKVPVPDDARDLAYSILAQRADDRRIAVEFLTDSGFPVKHGGFLYISSGGIDGFPQMASRWPKRTQLRNNWLYIGD